MEIKYSEKAIQTLQSRMSFLSDLHTTMIVSTVIMILFEAFGVFAIWMGWALLGVITCVLFFIPCTIAIGMLNVMSKLIGMVNGMIKTSTHKIFRVKCAEVQNISGSPLWRKVKTKEGIDVYCYIEDPMFELGVGSEIDVIVHKKKKTIRFAVCAIDGATYVIDDKEIQQAI